MVFGKVGEKSKWVRRITLRGVACLAADRGALIAGHSVQHPSFPKEISSGSREWSASYAAAVREAWGRFKAAVAGHLTHADACVMEREAGAASGSQKELTYHFV
eukprot:jgi/Tetstr1/430675/TSEL_020468.t1